MAGLPQGWFLLICLVPLMICVSCFVVMLVIFCCWNTLVTFSNYFCSEICILEHAQLIFWQLPLIFADWLCARTVSDLVRLGSEPGQCDDVFYVSAGKAMVSRYLVRQQIELWRFFFSITLHNVSGSIHSVEVLERKKAEVPWERRTSASRLPLDLSYCISCSLGLQPGGLLCQFWICHFCNCASPWLHASPSFSPSPR